MIEKYSKLKEHLEFGSRRKDYSETDAIITHYLHAFNTNAEIFFSNTAKPLLEESIAGYSINLKLPLKFDIPFPPPVKPRFTFIDLFAGIGGFRLAFQKHQGKCVFSSEWDKHSQKTYEANFGEVPFGDITAIDERIIPDHDILLGGFPCQPFSLAGVSKKNSLGRSHGFLDDTQGTLFFDIARILEAKRPKAFLLENVKNLRSHDKGRTFKVITETLEKLGYWTFNQIIDARDYVPQHRERIFIVGYDKNRFPEKPEFQFPEKPELNLAFGDILENNPNEKYTLSDKLWNYLQNYAKKHKAKGNGFGYGLTNLDGVSRTMSARYHKDGSEILIPQGKSKNPRRLTPNEAKKLMGFPESYKIQNIGVSDTQLYRQFGNSVAVPVVTAVGKELIKHL